ncbi:hypothetical protein [Ewingella americana]|uniref:Uncharacterized protein n=1 Tax=Ewingella americana TaxID=41202 RepID=A0A502GCJ1_9GAMM|nr:hypothetical protein [Ewingella americana]TPG59987.1 hypothetical protein EAH77_15585 [Ewingella americana]
MFTTSYNVNEAQKYKFTSDFEDYKKGDIVAEYTGHIFGLDRDIREIHEVPDEVEIIAVTSANQEDQEGQLTQFDCVPMSVLKKTRKFLGFYL